MRGPSLRRSALAGLLVTSVLLLASHPASAQATAQAKQAYDRGVAAQAQGDFARAGREFALADTLAPSSAALQAALDAATDGDDPVLGGELIERSKRVTPPIPKALRQSIDAAKKKLGGRAGRVRVTCPAGATCTATLDGRSFDAKTTAWATLGLHTLVVQVDGDAQTKSVDVMADGTLDFAPARKAAASPLPSPAPPIPGATHAAPAEAQSAEPAHEPAHASAGANSGFRPFVFFVGVGVTAVAGAATTYFMLNARSKHDDFVSGGCQAAPNPGCAGLRGDGESAQTSANVGLGVTAIFAVATVVIGAVFTRWNDSSKVALAASGARGAALALSF